MFSCIWIEYPVQSIVQSIVKSVYRLNDFNPKSPRSTAMAPKSSFFPTRVTLDRRPKRHGRCSYRIQTVNVYVCLIPGGVQSENNIDIVVMQIYQHWNCRFVETYHSWRWGLENMWWRKRIRPVFNPFATGDLLEKFHELCIHYCLDGNLNMPETSLCM